MDKRQLVNGDGEDYDVENATEEHKIIRVPGSFCYSVFTTLCCCSILGIPAIVLSLLSQDAVGRGNLEKGLSRARLSRKMSHMSLCVGLVTLVVCIGLGIAYGALFSYMMQYESRLEALAGQDGSIQGEAAYDQLLDQQQMYSKP